MLRWRVEVRLVSPIPYAGQKFVPEQLHGDDSVEPRQAHA
jgi:hypothetical protein